MNVNPIPLDLLALLLVPAPAQAQEEPGVVSQDLTLGVDNEKSTAR